MSDVQGKLLDQIDEMVHALAEQLLKTAFESAREVVQREVAVGPNAGARRSASLPAPSEPRTRALEATTVRKRRRGERRDGAMLEALHAQIEKYVSENPGQGIIQISEGLKLPTNDLKLPVQKLVEAKRLRRAGQKRGSRYFARETKSA